MTPSIAVLGYLLSVAMIFVAAWCWRKAKLFHVLLVESAHRIERLKEELEATDRERAKLVERGQQSKEQIQRLEKQVSGLKQKSQDEISGLEKRATAAEDTKSHLELKVDHYRSQTEALTRQLKEADDELKEAQTKLAYVQDQQQRQMQKLRQELHKEQEQLAQRLQSSERSLRESKQRQAATIDPEQLKDLTRKTHQLEALYRAMRGQREMAEERNRNWEVALRKLSHWIVSKANRQPAPTNLGPLVGAALETIGEGLIEDEFQNTTGDVPAQSKQ